MNASAALGKGPTLTTIDKIDSDPTASDDLANGHPAANDITAKFNPGQGVLSVDGGKGSDAITIARDAAGTILVNNGDVDIKGKAPTAAGTSSIEVSGNDGDDVLTIDSSHGTLPHVSLSGGNGNDVLTGGLADDLLDGGNGDDVLNGGDGNDTLLGGDGNDIVNGGRGNDVAQLGAGDDRFVWNPGDGSDTVDGEGGTDSLQFNGANIGENIDIAANGDHVRFFRDIGNVTMDLKNIEQINFAALGGSDHVVVNDLSGTGAKQVNIDLGAAGAGDGAADTVTVNGSAGANNIAVRSIGAETVVSGLAAEVHITGADASGDALQVNGSTQDDIIDASGMAASGMSLAVDGGSGNDTIIGSAGNDALNGGDGNDTVTGGRGNDVAQLGAGDDTFVWNPGDGSDVVEGQAGSDTLQFNGSSVDEHITVSNNGSRVAVSRDVGNVSMDVNGVEKIVVAAGAGNDTIIAGNGLSTLTSLTLDGGSGDDTIVGGDGDDTLLGGDGNDVVTGGRGSDNAQLGAGDDTFVWNPGDGSDSVDGQAGTDTLQFNGSNIGETITISANGDRAELTRTIGTVSMDLTGIEHINVAALGGSDHVVINDVSGTGINRVAVDLGATGGGSDGAADTVDVHGSSAGDNILVQSTAANVVTVSGGPALVTVANADSGDALTVFGESGDDVINASGLGAAGVALTIDGGAGNDTITGSNGNDMLLGGDGNDVVTGGRGNDTVQLGAGDDRFVWNPGDGSDTVDGQAGTDTLQFNGSNIGETIDISANGDRVRFFRDVAQVTMDLKGIEQIDFTALAGSDHVVVGDLSGTDAKQVNVDLGAANGGDGVADTVTVNGTAASDNIIVHSAGGETIVSGLAAEVHVSGAEAALDQLQVNGAALDDTIDASAVAANSILLALNGGAGNDTIIGSAGDDVITGGTGADVAHMGGGDDTFIWNPGDGSDTVEGDGGTDTLVFNGANIAEKIDITADGDRVRFSRDIAGITMDMKGVETVDFNARGGVDTIDVHDMTGTDVKTVNLDLGAQPGEAGGDGSNDVVIVEGTAGNDVIKLSMHDGALVVDGLAAQVVIQNFESGDQIRIMGLGGDDVIDATAIGAGGPSLVLDGGEGADLLLGGAGADTLLGGAGDDVLIGGPGQDLLDGGTGDNVLIQDGGNAALFNGEPSLADAEHHAAFAV